MSHKVCCYFYKYCLIFRVISDLPKGQIKFVLFAVKSKKANKIFLGESTAHQSAYGFIWPLLTYPKKGHHLWTFPWYSQRCFTTCYFYVNYKIGFILPQRFPSGIFQFVLCCVFLQYLWGTVWCSKVKFAFALYSRVPNTHESRLKA